MNDLDLPADRANLFEATAKSDGVAGFLGGVFLFCFFFWGGCVFWVFCFFVLLFFFGGGGGFGVFCFFVLLFFFGGGFGCFVFFCVLGVFLWVFLFVGRLGV